MNKTEVKEGSWFYIRVTAKKYIQLQLTVKNKID